MSAAPRPWIVEEQWSGLAIKPECDPTRTVVVTRRQAQSAQDDVDLIIRAVAIHDIVAKDLHEVLDFICWNHSANDETVQDQINTLQRLITMAGGDATLP